MYLTINNAKLFFEVYGAKLNITPDSVCEKPTLIMLHGGHGFADHTLYVNCIPWFFYIIASNKC